MKNTFICFIVCTTFIWNPHRNKRISYLVLRSRCRCKFTCNSLRSYFLKDFYNIPEYYYIAKTFWIWENYLADRLAELNLLIRKSIFSHNTYIIIVYRLYFQYISYICSSLVLEIALVILEQTSSKWVRANFSRTLLKLIRILNIFLEGLAIYFFGILKKVCVWEMFYIFFLIKHNNKIYITRKFLNSISTFKYFVNSLQ